MRPLVRSFFFLLFLPSLSLCQSLWQPQNPNIPSSETVLVFSPVNDRVCWACTVDTLNTVPSGYIRTTDGGITWAYARISGAGDGIIGQIAAVDADTAYAAVYVLSPSSTAGVYKTTNGGSTWTRQNAYGPSTSRYGPGAIHFFDASNGVVVGTSHPETYTTTDGGQHWIAVAMPNAYSKEYEQSEMVFAGDCAWFVTAGAGTRVFRTTNRGYTWFATTVGSQDSNWFPCIAFQDQKTGIYSEKMQEHLVPHHYRKTTDGGATWTSLSSAILDSIAPTGVRYIPGTNATYLISGGMNAGLKGLAITYDAGENWKLIDPSGALYLGFASDSVGWCSPHQHNNGVCKYVGPRLVTPVWVQQNSGTTRNLLGVYFTDVNTGTVVGDSGTILRTTDGGSTWTSQGTRTTKYLAGVSFADIDTGTVVGESGTILRTTDGGTTWAPQSSGTTLPLRGVWFTDASDGTVVGGGGDGGIILHTTNGGATWVKQFESDSASVNSVSFIDGHTGTAVGGILYPDPVANGHIILRTTDGGTTWIRQNGGGALDPLWSVSFIDANTGTAVGGSSAGEMGFSALILHTTNGGTTWATQMGGRNGAPVLYGVCLTDANIGVAVGRSYVGEPSGILRTTDGGTTWIPQLNWTSVELRGVFFTDANTGTAVGDYGTILRTTNRGASWIQHDQHAELPTNSMLSQNYPNPFNPSTTIIYELQRASQVNLSVYDILGRQVKVLVNEKKEAGVHEVEFNGSALASGVYLYKLTAGAFIQTRKMIAVK